MAKYSQANRPMRVDSALGEDALLLEGFSGTDEDFKKGFFVPGIQRAGGLQAARLLTNR